MNKNTFAKWTLSGMVLFALLACRFTPNLSNLIASDENETPTEVLSNQPSEISTPTDLPTEETGAESDEQATSAIPQPDPLNNLLALRSIKINLSGLHPDGTSRVLQLEIDSTGNIHLIYEGELNGLQKPSEELGYPDLTSAYELYIIDGKAFAPSKDDPTWVENPVDTDYLPVLSDQLHGLDGFTTWLDILPSGSLEAAGTETTGGFSTEKYSINGTVDGWPITGMLWYDPATHALVKAELHIPAVLNSDPENPEGGEYLITLLAEKADIAPVTLPSN